MQFSLRFKRFTFLPFLGLLLLLGCKDEFAERVEEQKRLDDSYIQAYLEDAKITNAQRQESGIYYIPGTPGTGAQIQKSNEVQVHYIGRSFTTGTFYSTYSSGTLATFVVGQTGLRGLDEGLQLLKNGERATIIIPSGLAYGRNYGNYNIPPNSILMYELEIKSVK